MRNKKKHILKTIGLLSILLLPVLALNAQENISYTLSTDNGLSQHPTGTILSDEQIISNTNVSASYEVDKIYRWYGALNTLQMTESSQYNTSDILVGFDWKKEMDITKYYLGASLNKNIYTEDFSYYESLNFTSYVNYKYYLSPTFIFLGNYSFNFTSFDEIKEASYVEHYLYGKLNKSFQTRTSIAFSLGFGVQDFLKSLEYESTGRRSVYTNVTEVPTKTALTLYGRLSQNLTNRVSVIGDFSYKNSANNATRDDVILETIDNPFIDSYRYNTQAYSLKMNVILPWSIRMSLAAYHSELDYIDVPVYEYDLYAGEYKVITDETGEAIVDEYGNTSPVQLFENRSTDINSMSMSLSKNFKLKTPVFSRVNTSLSVNYSDKNSNDILYTYKGIDVFLGLSFYK